MGPIANVSAARRRGLAAAYLGAAGLLALAAAAARAVDKPLGYLTREPVEAVSRSGQLCSGLECSYAGLLSNVGLLIGFAGAVCCFLAAHVLLARAGRSTRDAAFLIAGGALTTVLVLDDALMIHENVVPELIGGGEKVALGAYLAGGSLFVLAYRRELVQTHLLLLVAAVLLFAASVAADKLLDHVHLVEDGAKLFGLVTWTAYFTFTSLDLLARRS